MHIEGVLSPHKEIQKKHKYTYTHIHTYKQLRWPQNMQSDVLSPKTRYTYTHIHTYKQLRWPQNMQSDVLSPQNRRRRSSMGHVCLLTDLLPEKFRKAHDVRVGAMVCMCVHVCVCV